MEQRVYQSRVNTVDELKERLIAVWSAFRLAIIDTAIDQWRKRLQACVRANYGHFEHLLLTNPCKQFAFFMCFGSSGFCPSCQIFTVLMIDGR